MVWALGESASLRVTLTQEEARKASHIKMRCFPLRFEGAPEQQATLSVNQIELKTFPLGATGWPHTIALPESALKPGQNIVDLDFSFAAVPAQHIESSDDTRLLSAACDYIEILTNEPTRSSATPLQGRPNVILISIDTLRSDAVGHQRNQNPITPNLDDFSRDSLTYEQAIAHAPSTLSSHASILTSQLPHEHGASFASKAPLPKSTRTLAAIVRDAGYKTAAFHGGGQIASTFGLDQGFDIYEAIEGDQFEANINTALTWIDLLEADSEPFFLFLHTYQVHHPYEPASQTLSLFEENYSGKLPDRIEVDEHIHRINGLRPPSLRVTEEDIIHITNTYLAEAREVDQAFGKLVAELKKRDLYDRTLLIVTSDHGEEFGEHGKVGWHSDTLYDEVLRIPLMIRYPNGDGSGTREPRLVRGIDIAPTVTSALGLPLPDSFAGSALLARTDSDWQAAAFAVSKLDRNSDAPETTSIRTSHWKLIGNRLYDLRADPEESVDTALANPEVRARLRELLDTETSTLKPAKRAEPAPVLPSELQSQLEALGYIN
jgi:arylsulfatase A-like enzyme